jgi:putative ABC transport system permease protein
MVGAPHSRDVTLVGTYFAKHLAFGKDEFTTGVRNTHPWWKVDGTWPADDSSDVLIGEHLSQKLQLRTGDTLSIAGQNFHIAGVLSTGGAEDGQVVAPLGVAQHLLRKPDAVRRVYVSALTKPEDALARRDPKTMSGELWDRWYCSPYVQSIAYQLQEAIPHSHAEQIRQVAQNEGTCFPASRA